MQNKVSHSDDARLLGVSSAPLRLSGSKRQRRRKRGFTLIEMIVATFLLAIGVVASMAALSSSTRATAVSEEIHTAAMLGQKKLTEIELQPDTLSSGDQQGEFGDPYPTYQWKQSVAATDYPNLFQVTLTVSWASGSTPKHRVFTTYLRNDQNQSNTSEQTEAGQGGGNGG